jgi:hypothetical protein
MARPNVSIRVVDESLVAPNGEQASPGIGAIVSRQGLVANLGSTLEKQLGLMTVENVQDLFGRLRYYAEKELIAAGVTGITLQSTIGSTAASYIDIGGTGATKDWQKEWWATHNFLQYGGACRVGGTGSQTNTTATDSLSDPNISYDVLFMGDTAAADYSNLKTVVNARQNTEIPVLGVICATGGIVSATKEADTTSPFFIYVAGSKYHLNGYGEGSDDATDLISTNLSPDVAGCITRCDRDSFPWFSPAGRVRGRILNVVRLGENPSAAQQDTLYDNGINPVVTFPGEGTILFGDKTAEVDTSTLSRINVSRLFIYLRKVINPIARSVLFEINDAETRERFTSVVTGVLEQVRGQRGITDYRVICDETNNTPDLVQSRIFVADVLVKPTIATNYIRITFTNKNLTDSLG